MTEKMSDLVLSGVLLLFAIGWTITVWCTIPGGFAPGDIGARGFPLVLGIALLLLAVSLGIKTWLAPEADDSGLVEEDGPKEAGGDGAFGGSGLLLVVIHITAFGFLMERLGFILTTILVVASMLFFCVGERKLWKLPIYGIGTALVCWLIFGKLMGVYLPQGAWIMLG